MILNFQTTPESKLLMLIFSNCNNITIPIFRHFWCFDKRTGLLIGTQPDPDDCLKVISFIMPDIKVVFRNSENLTYFPGKAGASTNSQSSYSLMTHCQSDMVSDVKCCHIFKQYSEKIPRKNLCLLSYSRYT